MKKLFAMFPGQNSHYVGMSREILAHFPSSRLVFEEAEDATKINLRKLCLDGPEEELTLTANQQPAILTVSVAIWRALQDQVGFKPDLFAGHSLGEYSALVACDKLSLATAARLVRSRGQAMQEAVPVGIGGMAAVLKGDVTKLKDICQKISVELGKVVEVVNFNSPEQQIISGHREAVEGVCEVLKKERILCKLLKVSAPFHSSLMAPARERMTPSLREAQLEANSARMIPNLTGAVVSSYTADFLIKQIDHPVLWDKTIECARAEGTEIYLEVGPGKVLFGLLQRWLGKDTLLFHTDSLVQGIKDLEPHLR